MNHLHVHGLNRLLLGKTQVFTADFNVCQRTNVPVVNLLLKPQYWWVPQVKYHSVHIQIAGIIPMNHHSSTLFPKVPGSITQKFQKIINIGWFSHSSPTTKISRIALK